MPKSAMISPKISNQGGASPNLAKGRPQSGRGVRNLAGASEVWRDIRNMINASNLPDIRKYRDIDISCIIKNVTHEIIMSHTNVAKPPFLFISVG